MPASAGIASQHSKRKSAGTPARESRPPPSGELASINPAGRCGPAWGRASPLFVRSHRMKSGRSLVDLATELERQLASKKDLFVPSSLMSFETDDGQCGVKISEKEGIQRYGITELARRQLAEKLQIPFAYFERMRSEQPRLLDQNVNTWLQSEDERRLVRTLDGQVRAVLSDRFRRLDNWDLAEHLLPILQRLDGARFESVELTDTRLYLKVVTARVQCEVAVGDVVQAGVVVSNSEVGCGSLAVQPLLFRLKCKNGLIAPDRALRKHHVGRAMDSGDESVTVFKEDTLAADDRALFLKVRDVVETAVSEATFTQLSEKLRNTLGIKLAGDPVKAVEVLADRFGLSEVEGTGVLRHLISGGDLTGYGVVNAVTGYSQEVEKYDRATDLEALGGRLIELQPREWREIAEAA